MLDSFQKYDFTIETLSNCTDFEIKALEKEEFIVNLLKFISNLIDNEPNKFIQLAYRLDLDENLVKKYLLHIEPSSYININQLIIKKLIQKIQIRNYYKNS